MNKKGFTLLEMVVVVMIVAILFLLTIPNVSTLIGDVEDNACDALTGVIDAGIAQYKLKYHELPNSINDLIAAGIIRPEQATCSNGKNIYIENGVSSHE